MVQKALKTVENSIRLREGNFLIQNLPTISGENALNAIQEQLDQIKNKENAEEGYLFYFNFLESDEDHEEGIIANIGEDDDLDILNDGKSKKNKKEKKVDSDSDD